MLKIVLSHLHSFPLVLQHYGHKPPNISVLRRRPSLCCVCLTGNTQLRLLCEEDVPSLLCEALPPEWSEGNTVPWYPDDRNSNHPPREWIKVIWRYLQEHFTTEEDIQSLGKLPLIPLGTTQTPVTLARLCRPSRVVVKCLSYDCLDDSLTNILRKLGLIIMNDFPAYLRYHPAVLGAFVHPPSVQGVLQAMVISSRQMAAGRFSEIVRTMLSTNEKHLLRSFLARVRRSFVGQVEYNLLCSLPIFQTLSKKFVSKKEGLCAAVADSLPVSPLRELIDITQHDSKTLAVLLDVTILMPTELLYQMVFPDIQRGKYTGEQIDKLLIYTLENHTSEIRKNSTFKHKLQALPFVTKQRGRARAPDLFDPRNAILKTIFAYEDVFPTVTYAERSVLVMLEELGMKNEDSITGCDLYQSAKLVSGLAHLPTAEQKSRAILQFLSENPQKLSDSLNGQPLGALLKDIPWVSRLQERPPNYPPGLAWWETDEEKEKNFFKPTEVRSQSLANLVGTVMPLVELQASSQVSKYFGWQYLPGVIQVIQHLKNVIRSYSKEEKPLFMFVVNEIYLLLSRVLTKDVDADPVFDCFEELDWVWNGDGFSSPSHVLFSKPHVDLTPYILLLPNDMAKYAELFYRFGMRERSNPAVLVQVLHMIKEKYDDGKVFFSALEVRHDLQLSVNILNELASEQLTDELQGQIILPTHAEDNSHVRLEPVECCMYCHHDWLKREGDDEDMDYFYVHPNVPNSTAERLGVRSLTNRMLDADELSIGEEFGQEERLTTRLNRLLEEYTDGFSVLKELVQNADDAGATEVRFLYDERTNEDAMTCLIDEGMKGCQGPALWVYNDAEFKDEDFENIAKLNEATKEHDTEKIGRFGLGFNAVYNLTDVPMILSRNYFVIFDPHSSYLGKAIRDKRKPGMKINLNKDVKRLCKFANQFKPFNGIFGCDLHLRKEDNSFNGTLFRFPLRTREQALGSEIKKLNYDDREIRQLLQMLIDRSKSLLLFTQHVLRVEIYSMQRKTSQQSLPALLFQVSKSMSQGGILRELCFPVTLPVTAEKLDAGEQHFLRQCCFLQASSKVAREARYHTVHPSKFLECSIVVDIDCIFTKLGLKFFNGHGYLGQERFTWLVASAMGTGQAMKFVKSDESLIPSGGAAVRLTPTGNNKFFPLPAKVDGDEPTPNDVIFCYLPLPIHSGLPLHVNGAFAVAANRRHLQSKVEDDKRCYGFDWNKVLMQDSVLSAYFSLLEDIKSIAPDDGSYKFHSLWPKSGEVHGDCWPILQSFYEQLAVGDHALFSADGSTWVDIRHVVFLDPGFRLQPEIGDTSFAVLQALAKEDELVIDLPADVFQSFHDCGLWDIIQNRTYDKRRFFHEVFFPNILKVRPDLRDVLVLHVLDNCTRDLDELIKTHASIPASPFGKSLKCPSQLVNPNTEAAKLFCPDDGKFPFGTDETFLNRQRLTKLEQLGMVSDILPWKEIAERAESIDRINAVDSKVAVKRVKVLLSFIQKKLKGKGKGPKEPIMTRLVEAKCLPVLRKPEHFPLPWKGDEFQSRRELLLAPKDVFLKEVKYLVCCTEPLVDLEIPKKVTELLKLRNKEVSIQHVMSQLEEAICTDIDSLDRKGYDEVSRVCTEAYSFLQEMMTSHSPEIKQYLVDKKFILAGKRFLPADQVALEINADCSPYLYKLPEHLADSFSDVMKLAGVKEKFEEKDFISSLQRVERQFHDRQLDEETLEVTVHMAIQLGETLKWSTGDCSEIPDKWRSIYLPSCRRVMRPVSQLCMKDCLWISDDDDYESIQFVSDKIPLTTCSHLGVKTRRDEALQQHDFGLPCGQREKLTTRLKRILTGYPCEKDILKELLQNADDAQATDICFIKDPRHHPDEKVLRESWKPLQGPALCVYNNKPFTNADIKGIQTLGEGSKSDDPNKTGQYGVGFNAVYHLTDVPSFMSRGKEIGDVLCVFDPHCKYVPNATDKEPGRMYKDIEKMRRMFPDVFPCYLEDLFSIQNSTMFRLPLRTEEMAENSKISSAAVTVKKLEEMMEDLKKELFDILLFVNNVKKISLCGIDELSGKLTDRYSVEVLLSEDDDRKRKAFADCINEIGNRVKESNNSLPTTMNVKKCMYSMKLRDSSGREETWLIVQQVGFDEAVDKSIVDAFRKEKLGMLPRGGVACLLESTNSREQPERKKKAYCFLPLPLETDLPFHINGHFALDHEARRNLWRDVTGDYRTDWNNALLRDVIASCYLTLLDGVRVFLDLPIAQDRAESGTESRNDCRSTTLRKLSTYEELFPKLPIADTYWKTLVEAVYQKMSKERMHLIPLVRKAEENSSCRRKESYGSERVQVEWFPLSGSGKDKIYFNNLERKGCFAAKPPSCGPQSKEEKEERKRREEGRIKWKSKFEETLLETGLKLVAFSMTTFESLKKAEVEVVCVSPTVVMDFYKSFSNPDPLCNVGMMPCPVNRTPFKNEQGVIRILKYCKDDDHFLKNLSGLPLLLTEDNNLNAFSEINPRCLSRYQDIFPSSPSIFVHREVRGDIFSSPECVKSPFFRPLDVQLFASLLHETLPHHYNSEDHYVKWYPDGSSATSPNQQWIYRVWSFLREFAKDAMTKEEIGEDCQEEFIRKLLSPLSKWCLLPATKTIQVERASTSCSSKTVVNKQILTDHFLVPLCMAETVLDFYDCGISDWNLATIVKSLGLPKVNSVAIKTVYSLTTLYTKPDSYTFVRNLVASLKTPKSLLTALKQALETDPLSLEGKLQPSDATVVLEYFNRNVQNLTDVDKVILRKLPFFPTARGGLAKLEDRKSCIIPDELPEEEMDVVESVLDCLFLKSNSSLSDLFEFLDVESASPVEAYLKFVLKCFPYFSDEGKLAHIIYICQFNHSGIAKQKDEREIGKQRLLNYLKTVKFIPNKDGTLMSASAFYDPRNPVFKSMLTEDEFPPEPFASEEWLPHLEMIGLVQDVSKDDFQRFAKEVAQEAATKRNESTYTKSCVLVDDLISRPNVVGEGILELVCEIPFVASASVTELALTVCPPLGGTTEGEAPFIAFKGAVLKDYEDVVWTEAHLLPVWANPRSRQNEFDCPDGVDIEEYCNSFLAQLQIAEKPSVNLVVSHCQTICLHYERKCNLSNAPAEQCSALIKVMESIYAFLQENATADNEVIRPLETTRCILVEQGSKFIPPSQAVLELYESKEIKPYLYRIPPEFGKFQRLFEYLGCSKYVRATHYAMVLEKMQESGPNAKLRTKEIGKCFKAVRGFFARLEDDPGDASTISCLYLPAKFPEILSNDKPPKEIPLTLQKSTELVFNDVPAYRSRIAGLNIRFVLGLNRMHVRPNSAMINSRELMMKLPKHIKPVMLSTLVKEVFSNGTVVTTGAVNALKTRISSAQFVRGIVRIIRHVNTQRDDSDEGTIANVENGLRNIELCAVESLKTSLFHNNELIPGSEKDVTSFQEKVMVSGKEKVRVYLKSVTGMGDADSITSLIAQLIEEIYGEFVGSKAVLIPEMLRCPLADIWPILDRANIRQDDTCDQTEIDSYAEPGAFIPIEAHHMLNDAFLEFEPGEYVGYQLHDPSLQLEEGVATYIYAVIMEVIDEDASLLTKMYLIDSGNDESVEVNAVFLYKFHRKQAIFEQERESPRTRNRESTFREISELLEDAWRVPEEQRRQIVKRLILRWHPKKNLRDEEFCSKAFEHIKNEISQLSGSYDKYIDAWVALAIEHGTRREKYKENLPQEDGPDESSSCHLPPGLGIKNPQPDEAKRWLRQAEADLAAGLNEIDSSRPSYEWACFKCHQVRKAFFG